MFIWWAKAQSFKLLSQNLFQEVQILCYSKLGFLSVGTYEYFGLDNVL